MDSSLVIPVNGEGASLYEEGEQELTVWSFSQEAI